MTVLADRPAVPAQRPTVDDPAAQAWQLVVFDADQPVVDPDEPDTVVLAAATSQTLRAAVDRLGQEQAECLRLRFFAGLSVGQVAAAMGKNEGAIKALQYRAVRALHRVLPPGFLASEAVR